MSDDAAPDRRAQLGWALLATVLAIVVAGGWLILRAAERRAIELDTLSAERPSPWKKVP